MGCSIWVDMRMYLCLTLICLLSSSIPLRWSWSLNFASLMGMHSLTVLSNSSPMSLCWSSNWKAVMLNFHIHITLIQSQFASIVKLFIKRLIMVSYLYLRKIIEETIVSMTWLRLIISFFSLFRSLDTNWNSLGSWFLITCAT